MEQTVTMPEMNVCIASTQVMVCVCPFQGSELSGWALGRFTFEGIDLNHNFPDLNNILWDAQELATDKKKVSNHYVPMPEYYTTTEATVCMTYAWLLWVKIIAVGIMCLWFIHENRSTDVQNSLIIKLC